MIIATALLAQSAEAFKQDPCANCNEQHALKFQKCILEHGNPCAEYNEAGIVTKVGTKKDVGCCLVKEKHSRCLKCKTMDCAHNTCKVNKHYYAERTTVHAEAAKDKDWDKKAMKGAGW